MAQAVRERLLEEFDCSGLTQREFCEREGINFHTFVNWLSERRHQPWRFGKRGRSGSADTLRFREVVVSEGSQVSEAGKPSQGGVVHESSPSIAPELSRAFEAVLPNGVVLRAVSAQGLVEVLRLLGKAEGGRC